MGPAGFHHMQLELDAIRYIVTFHYWHESHGSRDA